MSEEGHVGDVSDVGELARRTWCVGAWKIPYEQRDVAHAVLTTVDDRGWYNIIGGHDDPRDGHSVPVGAPVTYRLELTDAEAQRFRGASNCRYVELDVVAHDSAGATAIPRAATMAWMRADTAALTPYHGRDVLIGLLDGGTTAAVRSYLDATMVAKQTFGADQPGSDEITSTHGCLVAPCLIPVGGRFLDAVVSNNDGTRLASASAAAMVWCADQGAKIVNYSGSGPTGSSVWTDALNYLRDRDVQFVAAAGNDGLNQLYYPAFYSTTYANVHSSISFDETTGQKSSFTNYDNLGTGCAPGTNVLGLLPNGTVTTWSGTSASTPHMARLIAMGATGGNYTPKQVAAALRATCRNTGQPAEHQGAGAWDLDAAVASLPPLTPTGSTMGRLNAGGVPTPAALAALGTFYAGQKLRPAQLAGLGTFVDGQKLRSADFTQVSA